MSQRIVFLTLITAMVLPVTHESHAKQKNELRVICGKIPTSVLVESNAAAGTVDVRVTDVREDEAYFSVLGVSEVKSFEASFREDECHFANDRNLAVFTCEWDQAKNGGIVRVNERPHYLRRLKLGTIGMTKTAFVPEVGLTEERYSVFELDSGIWAGPLSMGIRFDLGCHEN